MNNHAFFLPSYEPLLALAQTIHGVLVLGLTLLVLFLFTTITLIITITIGYFIYLFFKNIIHACLRKQFSDDHDRRDDLEQPLIV